MTRRGRSEPRSATLPVLPRNDLLPGAYPLFEKTRNFKDIRSRMPICRPPWQGGLQGVLPPPYCTLNLRAQPSLGCVCKHHPDRGGASGCATRKEHFRAKTRRGANRIGAPGAVAPVCRHALARPSPPNLRAHPPPALRPFSVTRDFPLICGNLPLKSRPESHENNTVFAADLDYSM
jgi:hypothetical protein